MSERNLLNLLSTESIRIGIFFDKVLNMNSETFENKIQAIIALFLIFSLVVPTIYGMVVGNFELLDKFIEVTKIPLGVVIAYYFGARYLHNNRPNN